MDLPPDGHVHSQWSWDARDVGAMADTCARAVAVGLPAVSFTEHVDFTPFRAGFLAPDYPDLVDDDGILTAQQLDVDGYFECIERCRATYPELTILAGMEVGQPHRHADQVADLMARGSFERVLGSLHCLPDGAEFAEPWELYPHHPAADVFRAYLAEIPRMVTGSEAFTAFAHIDYPVRSWPQDAAPFDPLDYEDELRAALRALAEGERALEINTRRPLEAVIVQWWRQEGGRLVTFGSDAHRPDLVGDGLAAAGRLAAAEGFEPDTHPGAAWLLGT
ncbi:PHP domain-containing protein [Kineococcus sp. R8]|nr:PHP domain-containing protein [Kineococcus siccus]